MFGRGIRQTIVRLCAELKNDAVALVDVIAPPDAILNSAIGRSDGNVSLVQNSDHNTVLIF